MGPSLNRDVRQASTGEAAADAGPPGHAPGHATLLSPGRNVTKAEVRVSTSGAGAVAVKDYSARPWWVRHTLGRWLIAREARAYRAARGIPGVLEFLGRTGPYSLATRYVDARPLFGGSPVDDAGLDRLQEILMALHARGIAFGDLHRRNVLVDRQGTVYVVDLATTWIAGTAAGRVRRWFFRRLVGADRIALARLRARAAGGDPAAAIDEVGGDAAAWYRRARRLRALRDRLPGRRSA